jgi:hypothetical protein
VESKTVKIDAKLHKKLRLVAVKGGHTLQDLMNDILKMWLRDYANDR